VTKECVLVIEVIGVYFEFERIGIIDFCEVTRECVLESETYWEVKRLHFTCGFERIGGIDFCEVTKEYVLETEEIRF
jgi:hypothetical protein